MTPPSSPLGEFDLIRRYFLRPRADDAQLTLSIGDDAALLKIPAGDELAVSVDTLVCGRHFLKGASARMIGYRSLAVNLSDMAAMGARPRWATLALTLPDADEEWLQGFAAGFMGLADEHGVALIGGDTTGGPLTISVQIMGLLPEGTALRRDRASAGDLLVVSGSLGDSGAGLKYVQSPNSVAAGGQVAALIRRFEYPTPRVQLGMAARGIVSGAMDLSDGIVGDLPKFAEASGLRARVDVERLPLSEELRALFPLDAARDLALGGGEDFELLFSVRSDKYDMLAAAAQRLNLTLSIIGQLHEGAGVQWLLNGADFAPRVTGYDHFQRASTQITV